MRPQMPEPQPIDTYTVSSPAYRTQELQRVAAHTSDELGFERANEFQALLAREGRGVNAGVVKIAAMLDQFGTKRLHRRVLIGTVPVRHDDDTTQSLPLAREGEALAVIATRCANDAAGLRPLTFEGGDARDATRSLNAPVGVRFSCLTQTSQ